jgi:hypothetical protein
MNLMGQLAPSKAALEEVTMVDVKSEETHESDRSRPGDYRRAMVVNAQVNETNTTTLLHERRSSFKDDLTEKTLLEDDC